ncbi:hypothetical protein D9M71_797280 [compost metagenome]
MLQHMERHMVHGDGRCRDQDRQPVAVEGEYREQGKDAEVRFDHSLGLVDV